jgi:hypothetical protein
MAARRKGFIDSPKLENKMTEPNTNETVVAQTRVPFQESPATQPTTHDLLMQTLSVPFEGIPQRDDIYGWKPAQSGLPAPKTSHDLQMEPLTIDGSQK